MDNKPEITREQITNALKLLQIVCNYHLDYDVTVCGGCPLYSADYRGCALRNICLSNIKINDSENIWRAIK